MNRVGRACAAAENSTSFKVSFSWRGPGGISSLDNFIGLNQILEACFTLALFWFFFFL